ncbi:MAG: muconolactone Delta-isomerase [Pseudomonadota bacterium]|nr:muconolactone Delta-isomerase [Pseudomonadota bacterium]
MLFLVRMDVHPPTHLSAAAFDEIKAREKAYAEKLQREGVWRHLWRVVGEYANVSVFDAGSNDELHQLLSGLPLFPYMRIHVTPLARHPSAVTAA